MWIAGAHVVAPAHYDTSDNIYIPLVGEKVFLLQPPAAHTHLRPYPALHAHYRQAQVRVDTGKIGADWQLSIGAAPTGPRRVVVRPGIMLYLPPYWFHHVTQSVCPRLASVL
jgi:hypothetical protein